MSENKRPIINLSDIRLQRLLFRGNDLASLNDYAEKAEMGISEVVANLEPWLDGRTLDIEAVGGDLFLHTAPLGRPQPLDVAVVPANLWEILRQVGDSDYASMIYNIIRGLQFSGWRCRIHPVDTANPATFLELYINNNWIPLFLFPKKNRIAVENGILDKLKVRNIKKVAIIINQKDVNPFLLEVRKWLYIDGNEITVVLLENPSFQPVILGPNDIAVKPRTKKYK